MTTEKLMDAIGFLPNDLITEADRLRTAPRSKRPHLRRWTALAACLMLVMGAGLVCLRMGLLSGMGGSTKSIAQEPAAMSPAAINGITQDSTTADAAPRAEAEPEEEAPEMDAHPLTLTLAWEGGSLTAEAGNFTLTEYLEDGSVSETIACGAHPLQTNPEPTAITADAVKLEWAAPPDTITVRCWRAGADVEEAGFPLTVSGSTLPVQADYQIYEITAVWEGVCTASYTVRLDLQTE